jgi:hypothetical protein
MYTSRATSPAAYEPRRRTAPQGWRWWAAVAAGLGLALGFACTPSSESAAPACELHRFRRCEAPCGPGVQQCRELGSTIGWSDCACLVLDASLPQLVAGSDAGGGGGAAGRTARCGAAGGGAGGWDDCALWTAGAAGQHAGASGETATLARAGAGGEVTAQPAAGASGAEP